MKFFTKLALFLLCLAFLTMCSTKYSHYSNKIDNAETPADIIAVATDIGLEDDLSSDDKQELMGKLSKHTAGIALDKIKAAAKGKNMKDLLSEALEYLNAVKSVLPADEYKELLQEYTKTAAGNALDSILNRK